MEEESVMTNFWGLKSRARKKKIGKRSIDKRRWGEKRKRSSTNKIDACKDDLHYLK